LSIYDQRDKPAYASLKINPDYCKNPFILSWWSKEHDILIANLIDQWGWDWYWHVTDRVKEITPSETIEHWRKRDPLCESYAWYNVIMYFAQARAQKLGLTEKIRKPQRKSCLLCNREFVEDSVPSPLVTRLGIDGLDYCGPCLQAIVMQGSGNPYLTKGQIMDYLMELSKALGQIPGQGFGEGMEDLRYLSKQDRLKVVKILQNKPSVARVKGVFGSWLKALIEAGVLEEGTRKTSRGTQCVAKDGDVCYSLAEKTVDDYLFNHGIAHKREPLYPGSKLRADFLVGKTFIEYFGLKGNPDYDAKIETKQKICSESGIVLVSLYSEDLIDIRKLEQKLSLFAMKKAM
jgi:hypothetical protein